MWMIIAIVLLNYLLGPLLESIYIMLFPLVMQVLYFHIKINLFQGIQLDNNVIKYSHFFQF